MIHLDEDAVICDLAEVYHVLNYRGLSPRLVAVLCLGLSDNSRIKRKMANRKLTLEELLLAALVDRTSLLLWSKTKDAERGVNKPKSVLAIFEQETRQTSDYQSFNSIEDFERKRAELLRG